jgi:hypothetical protein
MDGMATREKFLDDGTTLFSGAGGDEYRRRHRGKKSYGILNRCLGNVKYRESLAKEILMAGTNWRHFWDILVEMDRCLNLSRVKYHGFPYFHMPDGIFWKKLI